MTQPLNSAYIIEQYKIHLRSPHDIAEELGTYPNKIRRILKKNNVRLRKRSAATVIAYQTGRKEPSTLGCRLPDEVKQKIGAGVSEAWKNSSPERKKRHAEVAARVMTLRGSKNRSAMRKKAWKASVRKTRIGSKLSRAIIKHLVKANQEVSVGPSPATFCYNRTIVFIDGYYMLMKGSDYLQERVESARKLSDFMKCIQVRVEYRNFQKYKVPELCGIINSALSLESPDNIITITYDAEGIRIHG